MGVVSTHLESRPIVGALQIDLEDEVVAGGEEIETKGTSQTLIRMITEQPWPELMSPTLLVILILLNGLV